MIRNAHRLLFVFSFLLLTASSTQSSSLQQHDESQAPGGYFRFPAIHDDQIIFTAEGDLWQVSIQGGVAHRLTTHPAEESGAAISPDGKRLAFSAEMGVFGPEGQWLIEGHGVDPDINVDNLPKATFDGGDAHGAQGVEKVLSECGGHAAALYSPALPAAQAGSVV